MTTCAQVGDGDFCQRQPTTNIAAFFHFKDRHEMMRNAMLLFNGIFCGTNIHAAIHRESVGADDLASERLR